MKSQNVVRHLVIKYASQTTYGLILQICNDNRFRKLQGLQKYYTVIDNDPVPVLLGAAYKAIIRYKTPEMKLATRPKLTPINQA